MDNLNIFVEGDNNGFNSQNAKFKFKQFVKQHISTSFLKGNDIGNLNTLCSRFIKPDYELIFISYKDGNITVKLTKKAVPKNENLTKRDLLKAKIKSMSDKRTNVNYHKAKTSNNVPDVLLDVYKKASKNCKVPIPEPNEILKNPEQYKSLIQMLISNPEFKNNKSPYFKYFNMLGDLLNVDHLSPKEQSQSQQSTLFNNIVNIKGNANNKDSDTEDD